MLKVEYIENIPKKGLYSFENNLFMKEYSLSQQIIVKI